MPLDQTVRTEVASKIIKFENKINHFYLDSVGKVTVGVGHMIPNKQSVSSITMYRIVNKLPGAMATLLEKQKEFDNISKQKRNYKAEWYAKHTTLMMKDTDITAQLNKHIDSFYKELSITYTKAKGYPDDFDKLDKDVQAALFDMIFNLGATKLTKVFSKFDNAIKAGNWKLAAAESNRPQIDPRRNDYVKKKFISAASKQVAAKP